ncbi:MAG: aminotransferase class V-fold PLP-dependent enzyme [Cyanobacteriota bacterium]|nr:aminotransferase class V-fold PLP-dependent enzyme [Cyanobacteriota bacterium]
MQAEALGLHWDLEPGLVFLNHGSFGLAPRELLQWRFALLADIERDPVAFLVDALPPRLALARQLLAELVGAQPAQLAFVPSTTYGLNQLLQRLELPAGSEVLLSDHGYNATANLVRFACQQRGWTLRQIPLPLPLDDPQQVVQAFADQWGQATRLLLLDHITSPSALVLPLAALIALARERGARVIVDGAHGPGSVPLELELWQPDAYVGNLHKWLCCPRGSAFLWVREPWQHQLRPLVISHGANAPLTPDQSRFHVEHDWIGTGDPTPWLALPEALRLLTGSQELGPSWRPRLMALQQRHHALAQQGQQLLLEALGQRRGIAPAGMQAAMAAVPLPPGSTVDLQTRLRQQGFQVPVIPLRPHEPELPRFLRIACFAYNDRADLERLAASVQAACGSSNGASS